MSHEVIKRNYLVYSCYAQATVVITATHKLQDCKPVVSSFGKTQNTNKATKPSQLVVFIRFAVSNHQF